MQSAFLTNMLWGVYPYLCLTLFLVVPVIRMIYRPFGFSTRASSLFNRDVLGFASLTLHWGLVLLLLGHLAGFIGGLLGLEGWIRFFYWAGLLGGFSALVGSIIALVRRFTVPEVRAMSQWDDYVVHYFLIAIMGLALYQVLVDRIFGVAYTASSWLASVFRLAPQPELMASASLLSKWHVFLALTLFAVFPFTKLVHFWTFPVNYFVRPYQAMRTARNRFRQKWEYALRSDKSFLIYSLAGLAVFFGGFSLLLGKSGTNGTNLEQAKERPSWTDAGRLAGMPLYLSQCARCHGLEGDGQGIGARSPTFAALPRDFTANKYAFVSTDNGVASDADLAQTLRRGLEPAGMPHFAALDQEQIASLVSIVRGFAQARAEPPGATLTVPPPPAKASVREGRELFGQACAPCHGEFGRGDGPQVAAMRGFDDLPARPRDLTQPNAYKTGADPEQIYLRIAAGTPPVMPGFHSSLTPEQIWSIVRFLEADFISGKMAAQVPKSPPQPPPPSPPQTPSSEQFE